MLTPAPIVGGRRRGASVKTLKKLLKKAGLKTTGRKAALTRRVKKAHLKMRGAGGEVTEEEMKNPMSALPASPEPEEEGAMEAQRSFAPPDYYDGESGKGVRPSEAKKKKGGRSRSSRRGIFGKLKLY